MKFRLKWEIDRLFSGRSTGKQLLGIALLISGLILITTLVSFLYPPYCMKGAGVLKIILFRLEEVACLFFDPGNYPVKTSRMPHFIQLIFSFMGALTYTALFITFVGNFVAGRVESYRKGETRYKFDGHILILGGSRQLIPVLKSLPPDDVRDIVILTMGPVEEIRASIAGEVSGNDKFMNRINVFKGLRCEESAIDDVHASKASCIYIIGEDNEPEHDAVSIKAWRLLKSRFPFSNTPGSRKKCYLLLRTAASIHIFQYRGVDEDTSLETIVINHYEAIAQKVLITSAGDVYPCLDRTGIRAGDRTCVHFVIVGMTKMSYAMAATAAHVCHFPNFITKGVRTKITFIDPDAETEMYFFFGHHDGLEKLSKYTYVSSEKIYVHEPESEYGDFLDIEWEFIKGNVAAPYVRDMMEDWYEKDASGEEYLTFAFCNMDGEKNLAGALYLPQCFYDRKSTVPLFIYQPVNSELTSMAQQEVGRYRNLYPFGSLSDDYYRSVDRRRLEGKRINYLYKLHFAGKTFVSMPGDESSELNDSWYHLEYAKQMSSVFSANHIPFKNRGSAERRIAAIVEHNRWNMERLLIGYRPLPKSERDILNQGCLNKDRKCLEIHDDYKNKYFIHKDIAPYEDILPTTAANDYIIVDNLKNVAVTV